MRALLVVALLASSALAAEPEVADEVDLLNFQLAQAKFEAAQQAVETARLALALKYHLAQGDDIDFKTRHIKRAQKKPEPKK